MTRAARARATSSVIGAPVFASPPAGGVLEVVLEVEVGAVAAEVEGVTGTECCAAVGSGEAEGVTGTECCVPVGGVLEVGPLEGVLEGVTGTECCAPVGGVLEVGTVEVEGGVECCVPVGCVLEGVGVGVPQ